MEDFPEIVKKKKRLDDKLKGALALRNEFKSKKVKEKKRQVDNEIKNIKKK